MELIDKISLRAKVFSKAITDSRKFKTRAEKQAKRREIEQYYIYGYSACISDSNKNNNV